MKVELEPVEVNPDPVVLRVFLKSIELLGGLRKLAEFRALTWLPSIARAAYAVVLKEEFNRTEEEIAREIGLAHQSVRNILRADSNAALEKIKREKEFLETEGKEPKVHTAGGIVKLAYKLIREGEEESKLFVEFSSQVLEALSEEVPWAYILLKAIKEKGIEFPISGKEEIISKLGDVRIKKKSLAKIAEKLPYPINNPAFLLREVKKVLDQD